MYISSGLFLLIVRRITDPVIEITASPIFVTIFVRNPIRIIPNKAHDCIRSFLFFILLLGSKSIILALNSLDTVNFFPKRSLAVIKSTIIFTTTIGVRFIRNSLKSKPPRLAMIRFGGSPIIVAVPPMLQANICTIINGNGSIFSFLANKIVMGTIRRIVVTLSRKAEHTAVTTDNIINIFIGSPLAC